VQAISDVPIGKKLLQNIVGVVSLDTPVAADYSTSEV
jgi:hypothetical protein